MSLIQFLSRVCCGQVIRADDVFDVCSSCNKPYAGEKDRAMSQLARLTFAIDPILERELPRDINAHMIGIIAIIRTMDDGVVYLLFRDRSTLVASRLLGWLNYWKNYNPRNAARLLTPDFYVKTNIAGCGYPYGGCNPLWRSHNFRHGLCPDHRHMVQDCYVYFREIFPRDLWRICLDYIALGCGNAISRIP